MSDTKSELKGIVLGIVNDLEAAADGRLYNDGSNYVIIDDMDEWKARQYAENVKAFKAENPEDQFGADRLAEMGYNTYEEWMEDEIGTAEDIDDPDEVSIWEYVDDQSLGDMRFEIDSEKSLCGAKVLFCYGGPNVWVHDDKVCGYWGCDSEETYLDGDTSSKLFSMFEERWALLND